MQNRRLFREPGTIPIIGASSVPLSGSPDGLDRIDETAELQERFAAPSRLPYLRQALRSRSFHGHAVLLAALQTDRFRTVVQRGNWNSGRAIR